MTTYKIFFASLMQMPAGEILLGHFSPNFIESISFNLLFMILYFKIQLSLPPEAYKFFSSALKAIPNQDLSILILSKIVFETKLIS